MTIRQQLQHWSIAGPAQKHFMRQHAIDPAVLARNAAFRGTHRGERCFIVGNGPSVKEQDLSLLADEQVFSMNYAYKMEHFAQMRPNFHLYMDGSCFDEELHKPADFTDVLQKADNPVCFLPYLPAKQYVERHPEMEALRPYYLFPYYAFTGFDMGFPVHGELEEGISNFYTVVQYAILIAVYMGFAEIYLLGCDCTGILTDLAVMQQQSEVGGYAYDFDEEDQRRLKAFYETHIHLEDTFFGWANIFKGYRYVGAYCAQHGVKLLNATRTTALDTVPRVRYESLF